ncbi:nuclear transport factor 2 family protein [Ideonella sp. A 288]|uniref:nuclear transport factor 2 family protein n=1 Tax=Ideonella sp. A 288 TaxID=1962181 RepID=UPI000B4A7100|nr:nuclear transport factor 2 family protein [Ideonella sp. A 288]
MNPALPVQRQLDAYNAKDLAAFVAQYADDVRLYRPPAAEPVLVGKAAMAAHYAAHRFNLPHLHAELVNRMVLGCKVIDHERITGLSDQPVEAAVVFEVHDGLITTVWFFNAE